MTDYNDGQWHGWNGGECPVHPKTDVEGVYINSEGVVDNDIDYAEYFPWFFDGESVIIAFRVVKPYVAPPADPLEAVGGTAVWLAAARRYLDAVIDKPGKDNSHE